MANCTPGMVVVLKSGGPIMTVEKVYQAADGKTRVSCQWFDKDGKLSSSAFMPETLDEYSSVG